MNFQNFEDAIRFAAGKDYSTLASLLRVARENPHDTALHGAIADHLEELRPESAIPGLIRKHLGLEPGSHHENHWYEPVENSWDGSFPYKKKLGSAGPFDLYLGHEGGPEQHQKWVVHAVSNLRGSRDFGYNFEWSHEHSHEIPKLFPSAAQHISDKDEKFYPHEHTNGGLMLVPRWQHRAIEAHRFGELMDRQERERD